MLVQLRRSGFGVVALSRPVYGRVKKSDKCEFDKAAWEAELGLTSSGGGGGGGRNGKKRKLPPGSSSAATAPSFPLTILTRMTVVAEEVEDVQVLAANGRSVSASYDVVALQPTNSATFEAACERGEVDLISLDCTQRLPFHIR